MNELNYSELLNEITEILQKETSITFATCADNQVMARVVCHINYGMNILFSTSMKSQKVEQIKCNPKVALAVNNIKVEGIAELYGHPSSHETFGADYAGKYPHLGSLYESKPDDVLIIIKPTKIALYKYINGPCEDILLPLENKAYRINL